MNNKKGFVMVEVILSIVFFLYLSMFMIKVINRNIKFKVSNKRIKNNMEILNVIREKVIVDNEKEYHVIIPKENLTRSKITHNKISELSGKKGDRYVEVYKMQKDAEIILYEKVGKGHELYKVKK